eukprot:scaffold7211_cov247-Ochromonas_danica.AAC.9
MDLTKITESSCWRGGNAEFDCWFDQNQGKLSPEDLIAGMLKFPVEVLNQVLDQYDRQIAKINSPSLYIKKGLVFDDTVKSVKWVVFCCSKLDSNCWHTLHLNVGTQLFTQLGAIDELEKFLVKPVTHDFWMKSVSEGQRESYGFDPCKSFGAVILDGSPLLIESATFRPPSFADPQFGLELVVEFVNYL